MIPIGIFKVFNDSKFLGIFLVSIPTIGVGVAWMFRRVMKFIEVVLEVLCGSLASIM